MAEIVSPPATGVKKQKKLSTRVDLTPMVDLGFLLITFFIFTTTMSRPTAMRLILPADSNRQIETKASGALTIILGADSKVFSYEGVLEKNAGNLRASSFSGIREILINKKRQTRPEDLMIIIKACKEASYGRAVDILDEMNINDIKRYAFVDVTKPESDLIEARSR